MSSSVAAVTKSLALSVNLIFLVSCQGDTNVSQPGFPKTQTFVRAELSQCGTNSTNLKQKGGKLGLPAFDDDGDFGGIVHYAPNAGGGVALLACPGATNLNNVPVPQGFTPDWFCDIDVGEYSIQFGSGDLVGSVTSKTLLHNEDYYLYAYDDANTLIGSYGPFLNEHKTLHFTSPFENGFAITGPRISLEIAHPTP